MIHVNVNYVIRTMYTYAAIDLNAWYVGPLEPVSKNDQVLEGTGRHVEL